MSDNYARLMLSLTLLIAIVVIFLARSEDDRIENKIDALATQVAQYDTGD